MTLTKSREELSDALCEMGAEGSIMLDGYEDAAVGVTIDGQVVYDYDKMVRILQERDGMTEDEAIEWISYNTIRSLDYVPEEGRPVIINLMN